MAASQPQWVPIRFGLFELDLRAGELRKNGIRVRLQQQPLQILVALINRPGEIVTREELRQQLWPNDTFVDFDHGLNAAVKRLRDALGESADSPVYIETLARRGYRFIAPINSPEAIPRNSVLGGKSGKKPLWVALIVAVLGISVAALWIRWPRPPIHDGSVPSRLTANSTEAPVINAAVSPDYTYLAYADKTGLYLKHIRSGETRALSLPPGFSAAPLSWFPDGAHLLVSMTESAGASPGLWMISALGGSPRKLMDDVVEASISPDGSRIAVLRDNTAHETTEIWLLRSDGTDPIKLVPRVADRFVLAVAWSPDNRHLAWLRQDLKWDSRPSMSVEVIDMENSESHVVFSDQRLRCDLDWTTDKRLIYTLCEDSDCEGNTNAWSVPITDSGKITGAAVRLTREPGWISKIMTTRDARHLVILRTESHERTFVARLSPDQNHLLDLRRLNLEETLQQPFAWTPDSKSVIVTSDRNGRMGIYKQAIDRGILESLIQGTPGAWLPRLSPDGTELLYRVQDVAHNSVQIFASPVSGGTPRLLLSRPGIGNFECTSSRANFCVFHVEGRSEWVFFRLDPKTGKTEELTRFAHETLGINWGLSPDGKKLAIIPFSADGNTIYVRSIGTGQTEEIQVKGWSGLITVDWSPDGKSLFVATLDRGAPTYPTPANALLRVSTDGKAWALLRGSASESWVWAVPSPDGRLLAINGPIRAGNVWSVDAF